MGLGDVNQLRGTLNLRHAQHDLHGNLGGFAVTAGEQCTVVFGQFDRGMCFCGRCVVVRWWSVVRC